MANARGTHAILAALLAAAALSSAAHAQGEPSRTVRDGPGPDAARLRAIEAELRDEARARILGPIFDVEVAAPRALEEGVAFENIMRRYGGGIPRGDNVAWSEIEKLQVRRSSAGRGALIGTVAGAALGLVIGLSMTRDCGEGFDFFCGASSTDVATITMGFAGAGMVTGTISGAPFHHWKTVYDSTK